MRVDFYQLSRDPVEAALPLIARATLNAEEKLLVVSADAGQLGRISDTLWQKLPESFLAHGLAGQVQGASDDDKRQPILLSDQADAANGARYFAIADGQWREGPEPFERTFYFFDGETLDQARQCWRDLGERDGIDRRFWKQEGGKWVEGP